MGSFSSKNNGYVNVGTNSISEENIIIVQCIRKKLLLKQFNEYIKNANQSSVYHGHFVGTREIVSFEGITKEYCVKSTIFFTLWSFDVTNYENDKNIEWIN